MKINLIYVSLVICLASLFATTEAMAATIFLTPPSASAGVNERVIFDVRIDSGGAGFNASQATIRFPKDTLEVVSLDKSDSSFSFWLEEPNFSNNNGVISFIGGTPYGVSGSSIQVLKIVFRTKGSGSADINFTDVAITASDGSGTNILSKINNANLTISPVKTSPIAIITPPQQIIRQVAPGKDLPVKPVIEVPLYPLPTEWYNVISPFSVSWGLPLDISGISIDLNKEPNFIPSPKSNGLFDSKAFDILKDGVSYLHIRFQNSVGWGATAHYRLAVDTQPPLGFDIAIAEGTSTDNPTPTLYFKTSDALSGVGGYLLRIDNGDLINIPVEDFEGVFKLHPQAPGKHDVVISAVDLAGNSVESSVNFEILPIASPTITFSNKNTFIGEENLSIRGTAISGALVLLFVRNENGVVITESQIVVDDKGNWEAQFGEIFKKGSYFIEAIVQDERGALSLPVISEAFNVRERPLLVLGSFEVTQLMFFMIFITIIAITFVGGWFSYQLWREQVERKSIVAQRDVINIFVSIRDNVEKILKNYEQKHMDSHKLEEVEFLLKKIKIDIDKTQKYIIENIKEIGQ